MLSSLQFSQLAAAAWAGPAPLATIAGISHYQAASGYQATCYTVSYHFGTALYSAPVEAQQCPFQAVASAVAAAAAAGVAVSRPHAQRTIARTAAALCGVQLVRPGFACRARRHRVARRLHA